MSIYMIGIDHSKAVLDIRSLFAFSKRNMYEFMNEIYQIESVEGIIVLSTCNRMEIWVSANKSLEISLYKCLCNYKHLDENMYKDLFESREDYDAVNHLFHLACGLKSQILGEDQIVTQVGNALTFSREAGFSDSVLEVLFRKAVTAAKRVKTEVVFPHGNSSVISSAIERLDKLKIQINEKKCLVIGNGEMGKVAAKAFYDAGADVAVTVRQYNHGNVEIPVGCKGIDYCERINYLNNCDFVVSATTSPHYTITKEQLQKCSENLNCIFIDLAVPRDIDPSIKSMGNIKLFDMDDFNLNKKDEKLLKAKAEAEIILKQIMKEFYEWHHDHSIIPRIQFVKEESVKDINLRLSKQFKRLDIEETEKEKLLIAVDKAAEKVINKMIFGLRDSLEHEAFTDCVKGLEQLYE